jgi:hypothetical protein
MRAIDICQMASGEPSEKAPPAQRIMGYGDADDIQEDEQRQQKRDPAIKGRNLFAAAYDAQANICNDQDKFDSQPLIGKDPGRQDRDEQQGGSEKNGVYDIGQALHLPVVGPGGSEPGRHSANEEK